MATRAHTHASVWPPPKLRCSCHHAKEGRSVGDSFGLQCLSLHSSAWGREGGGGEGGEKNGDGGPKEMNKKK